MIPLCTNVVTYGNTYKVSRNSESLMRYKISKLCHKIYYFPTSCYYEEIAVVGVRCCGFSWYITSNYVGLYVYVFTRWFKYNRD